MRGEHPPARRRSGRRTRDRRAATGPDLDADPATECDPATDPDSAIGLDPGGYGRAGTATIGTGITPGGGEEPALAQPAWSEEWTAGEREERRQERGNRERGNKREPDDPESRARQICLRQLSLAPRTRAQLHEALTKRDIPDDVAEAVLGRFADVGLIDDAAFARAWVESRHYSKGLAGRALKAELRRRGVDDDDIKEAVSALGPDAEAEAARHLVTRKLASTKGKPAEVRTRRLAGMLARKGYPAGLSFRVIREALEAEAAEGADDASSLAFDETQAFLGDEPPVDPADDGYVPYAE